MLWAYHVAPGNEKALRVRVYGERGGLEWQHEHPTGCICSRSGSRLR
jgi:hypothetical protein